MSSPSHSIIDDKHSKLQSFLGTTEAPMLTFGESSENDSNESSGKFLIA